MSCVEEKEAAVRFLISELRGEGVKITEKTARDVAERHFAKSLNKRSRIPRDFQAMKAELAETGT